MTEASLPKRRRHFAACFRLRMTSALLATSCAMAPVTPASLVRVSASDVRLTLRDSSASLTFVAVLSNPFTRSISIVDCGAVVEREVDGRWEQMLAEICLDDGPGVGVPIATGATVEREFTLSGYRVPSRLPQFTHLDSLPRTVRVVLALRYSDGGQGLSRQLRTSNSFRLSR